MGDKTQLCGEYKFQILGQHHPTKTTNGKKKLNINEVTTATILARFKHNGIAHETIIPRVPLFLWDAYNCLTNTGYINNEIFRKSGSTKRISDFFNHNPAIFTRGTNFSGLTQLDVGTLMKDFLRERFDPFFTSADPVLRELDEMVKLGVGIEFDCHQNPEMATLVFVIKALHSLCLKDPSGRMTPSNLAVYFTPIFVQDHHVLKQHNFTKNVLARNITLFSGLIGHSQNVIVRSTTKCQFSIDPKRSDQYGESRRASSVFGRLIKYVSNGRSAPKVTAFNLENLKICTPDGRQPRSRTRRTPNSSTKKHINSTTYTPKSISTEVAPTSSAHVTPKSHHIRSSMEEPPKMRTDDTIEYLMEARRNLDFTERKDEGHESVPSTPFGKPLPLEEILTCLQNSVEKLQSESVTPIPCDPSTPDKASSSYTRYVSPSCVTITPAAAKPNLSQCRMGTPEAVVADLLDQVTKASKELDQLVKEMSPMNRAIETLKKETKDQGCSPIRLPEAGENHCLPAGERSYIAVSSTLAASNDVTIFEQANSSHKSRSKLQKCNAPEQKFRTKSGTFDGFAVAHIIRSTTQDELENLIGPQNFPLHRPSIALLTVSKPVTKNIARLESAGEASSARRDDPKQNGERGRSFTRPTMFSNAKGNPNSTEFRPALPKSRSTGPGAGGLPTMGIRPRTGKSSVSTGVLVSKIPPKKMIPILKDEAGHPCRASFSVPVRGPGVPSYAAPTVSSIQHSVLHQLDEAVSSSHAQRHEYHQSSNLSHSSEKRTSIGHYEDIGTSGVNRNSPGPLENLEALISRLSESA